MTDDTLPALRREIDRIDGDLHALLMERGRIIDRLIAAKGTADSGSAFRPAREAAMLGVLAGRHAGRLPLGAVEAIWRIIISTFTFVQAPFAVRVAGGPAGAALRDSARFHFGFEVPLEVDPGVAEVIAAVAASRGDLGLVAFEVAPGGWWRGLEGEGAPKVIVRLPFLPRAGHPAGLPVLVVARQESDEGPGRVGLWSVEEPATTAALAEVGATRLAAAEGGALIAAPREVEVARLGGRAHPVGGYPPTGPVSARG